MKKIFLLLFFIIFLSSLILSNINFGLAAKECTKDKDCPEDQACVKGKCVTKRALELVYPEIPGVPTPKYVSTWLPDYINYIFRFSIILIGILIFGVLVYNGISYLTSLGSPAKLLEAKKGILAAFLGGIILLSAHLIFTTINPQLMVLEPVDPKLVDPIIPPGVYLCNYNYKDIGNDLQNYLTGDKDKRLEGAIKIREAIGTSETKEKCLFLKTSGYLRDYSIEKNKTNHTIFIVPRLDLTKAKCQTEGPRDRECWIWEYGIVFQESPKTFSGGERCKLLPEPISIPSAETNFTIYTEFSDFYHKFSFDVRSFFLFKRPADPIPELAKGVTLYEGEEYNEKEEGLGKKDFEPTGSSDVRLVRPNELKEIEAKNKDEEKGIIGLHHNTKSIGFDPGEKEGGGYLAILFGQLGTGSQDSDETFEVCEVREKADADLTNNPIGQCGKCGLLGKAMGKCYSCLERLYVIKGKRI